MGEVEVVIVLEVELSMARVLPPEINKKHFYQDITVRADAALPVPTTNTLTTKQKLFNNLNSLARAVPRNLFQSYFEK